MWKRTSDELPPAKGLYHIRVHGLVRDCYWMRDHWVVPCGSPPNSEIEWFKEDTHEEDERAMGTVQ